MLALPSEKAAEIALRTQQVIMEETGVVNVADPLGGSWYVEALTDEIEAEAEEIFARIKEMGGGDERARDRPDDVGILRGIEDGWFMAEIAEAAFQLPGALEKGDKKVVGVNMPHRTRSPDELEILRVCHEVELEQVREPRGSPRRPRRRRGRARAGRMVEVARTDEQHDPGDARRRPRRGDPGRDLRRPAREWGEYPEPARF